ncbi:unnamed protein product, partial [Ectocarpus sp. 4 AP-2014]
MKGGSSLVRWMERAGKPEMYATKVFNTLNREQAAFRGTTGAALCGLSLHHQNLRG